MEGALPGVSPTLMPAAHALVQAKRDIARAVEGLSREELWACPHGAPSVGFHLRHTAGSIDRLLTYTRDESLTQRQLALLHAEAEVDESEDARSLIEQAHSRINHALAVIVSTPDDALFALRGIGRERLPTNVLGLLFHIAEHTMRHTGQIVTTAKIVRNMRADS